MSEPFDLGALIESAQAMQERLLEAQAAVAGQVVEGQAGGGAVRVRMTGDFDVESVSIAPGAVDPDDVAMLEDLVLAAVRDAVAKARALAKDAMEDLDLGSPGAPGPGDLVV